MKSYISQKDISIGESQQGKDIREGVFQLIKTDFPGIGQEDYISLSELNHYRRMYLTSLISQEAGDMAELDHDVLEAIKHNSILSENIKDDLEIQATMGERIADKVAAFGGSWTFIVSFFVFIVAWMCINILILANKGFDPYPFILLNLILSCIAAIQAPIIMMSQNRQEQKDRKRNEHDYKINLKAELEIKLLNEKIDHLLVYQNKKLLEIQEIQIDYLEDLLRGMKGKE